MSEKLIPVHMRILAERVHLLRRRKRLSQVTLAKKTSMSPTTLSHIEKCHAPSITVEHLMALAQELGATPNVLLGVEKLEIEEVCLDAPAMRRRHSCVTHVARGHR